MIVQNCDPVKKNLSKFFLDRIKKLYYHYTCMKGIHGETDGLGQGIKPGPGAMQGDL
jgi:hypothetical protein